MKLPWMRQTRESVVEPDNVPHERVPRAEVHRSPGFDAACSVLALGPAGRVLDLGPAIPENIEFLAGFAPRIQVVDAFRDSRDPVMAVRTLNNLMPDFERAFHLVLLWDYLNYMSTEQGAALVAAVAPLCGPDARCLALVAASESMPASPNKYRVLDGRHLAYERTTMDEIGAPQLTPVAVERIFSGFSIDHAFVLRNGVREFVAVRDSTSA